MFNHTDKKPGLSFMFTTIFIAVYAFLPSSLNYSILCHTHSNILICFGSFSILHFGEELVGDWIPR